jgi:hypothetical protein
MALFLLVFGMNTVKANHLLGTQITCKWVDTMTFDFYVTYYRDCMGVDFSNPSYYTQIRCESGTSILGVTLKLKSITDISLLCDSAKTGCNPANTSNTGKGVEAHVYTVRIDFRQSPYNSLLSCSNGQVILETEPCCRIAGASYSFQGRLHNFAMLNLGKAPVNNSPDFLRTFDPYLYCNQPYYFNLFPIEKDGDSLSFSLECALDRPYVCDNYPGNQTPKLPVTVYYPSPLKYPYVNINSDPPIGFYFDQTNSDMIFTPTKCDETMVVVIEAKEWRKNKSGVYEHIGTVRREGAMFVVGVSNYAPQVASQGPFGVLADDSLHFSVVPTDKGFTPPAPAKTIYDSVVVQWLDSIPGAQYSIVDTNRIQIFQFSWKPELADVKEKPYLVTLSAIDDKCPYPGSSFKQFQIYVGKKIGGKLSTIKLNCLQYRSDLKLDSPAIARATSYNWSILDSLGNQIVDERIWFKNGWRGASGGVVQDFEISKPGKYIVKVIVLHHQLYFQNFFDTIIVTNDIPGWFTKSLVPLCPGDSLILKPEIVDPAYYSQFQWTQYSSILGTNDSLIAKHKPYSIPSGYAINYKGDIYRLRAKDSSGCFRVDETTVFSTYPLETKAPNDNFLCEGTNIQLTGTVGNRHPLVWDTAYWSNETPGLSTSVDTGGLYVFTARNECAVYRDTVVITEIPKEIDVFPTISKLCFGDTLVFDASFDWSGYLWSNGSKAAAIKVESPGTYWVKISTSCGIRSDTTRILNYEYKPKIELGGTKTACIKNGLTLDAGITGISYLWNTGDTTQKILVNQGGEYHLRVANMCGFTDDTVFVVMDAPLKYELGLDIETNNPAGHLLDAGNPGAKYLWNTGEKTRTIKSKTYGIYWVKVSNACGTISDTIRILEKLGIEKLKANGVSIYPNPGRGKLTIEGPFEADPLFQVFDVYGRRIPVKIESENSGKYQMELLNDSSGTYVLSWFIDGTRFRKAIVIEQ